MALMFLLTVAAVAILNGNDAIPLPEMKLTTAGLIKYWKYPVETHEATTKDGYILTLFRIPHGRTNTTKSNGQRPVFFLQHALMSSSADWVDNLPAESLGFVLADHGYDVWLGNVRGNRYCKKHKTLDVTSKEFWDFSIDEHAKYDLPAMVDYVLQHTNEKRLHYVGHSQGTVLAFAALSENQDLQGKIRSHFALGPITRMMDVNLVVRIVASQRSKLALLWKIFGVEEFFPDAHGSGKFCYYIPGICNYFMGIVSGKDNKFINKTRLPIYIAHTPAGTTRKNMLHWLQLVNTGLFSKYDYGWYGNIKRYGSTTPPEYDITKIQTPTVLVTGTHDTLASTKGALWTKGQLQRVLEHIQIEGYNHVDFIWGMNAAEALHNKIVDIADDMK